MSALGKRYLHEIIQHPFSFQKEALQERHDLLHQFQTVVREVEGISFPDVEWQYLRWKRKKLTIRSIGSFVKHLWEISQYLRKIPVWETSVVAMDPVFHDHIRIIS